jgi:ABC-type nickel/cobalt efflux system permease component RcnA
MNYGWIEVVVVAILALGFGFWQLWSVNREIRRDKEKKASAGTPRHAEGEHPLDNG